MAQRDGGAVAGDFVSAVLLAGAPYLFVVIAWLLPLPPLVRLACGGLGLFMVFAPGAQVVGCVLAWRRLGPGVGIIITLCAVAGELTALGMMETFVRHLGDWHLSTVTN